MKDYVFALVCSLDKTEKRSFHLYLSKYNIKNGSKSKILFDAMNKMEEYDEVTLKKLTGNSKNQSRFNYEKHRLNNQILQFLVSFHQNKRADIYLHTLIKQIKLLIDKNLLDHAKKLIKKGIEISEETHSHLLVYFFNLEKMQISHLETFEEKEALATLNKLDSALDNINNEHQFYSIYRRTIIQHFNSELINPTDIKASYNWLKETLDLNPKNEIKTLLGQIYWLQTNFIYYTDLDQNEKILEFNRKGIELIEDNPIFLTNNLNIYFGTYFNYIRALIEASDFDRANFALQKIGNFPTKYAEEFSPKIDSFFHVFYYGYFIAILKCQFEFELLYKFMKSNQVKLSKYLTNYNEYRTIEYLSDKIVTSFLNEEFKEVVNYLEEYENLAEINLYPELYYQSKMLGFLSLYETNNKNLLEPHFNSLYYYARKKKIQSPRIKFELKLARKIANIDDPKKLQLQFHSLQNEADQLDLDLFDEQYFHIWYKSKLENISIKKIVRALKQDQKLIIENKKNSYSAVEP